MQGSWWHREMKHFLQVVIPKPQLILELWTAAPVSCWTLTTPSVSLCLQVHAVLHFFHRLLYPNLRGFLPKLLMTQWFKHRASKLCLFYGNCLTSVHFAWWHCWCKNFHCFKAHTIQNPCKSNPCSPPRSPAQLCGWSVRQESCTGAMFSSAVGFLMPSHWALCPVSILTVLCVQRKGQPICPFASWVLCLLWLYRGLFLAESTHNRCLTLDLINVPDFNAGLCFWFCLFVLVI